MGQIFDEGMQQAFLLDLGIEAFQFCEKAYMKRLSTFL